MCGICGTAALNGVLDPAVADAVPAMTAALHHRGPDGGAVHVDRRAALGHRRLAIIDREGGAQPMSNEDGTCWVVFNGEIYNHNTLRRDLERKGHVFRTSSDTETIVHAYEEYGAACVDLFEGMFAFAVYDAKTGDVLLARDRLGKKPLFYAIFNGVLHFASEIKSLTHSPYWDGELDLTTLEGYLSLGYFVAPDTVYRHVKKLEAGHWLRARNGTIDIRRYWDVTRFDDDHRPSAEIEAELEHVIRDAVQCRLESEVPLGAFLSGGIDSGLVVSFMAEQLGAAVRTTSVGFGDAAHNELDGAALTAARFGTCHRAEVVEPRLDELLDPIVMAFDEPFADSSAIPTYYVAARAREHVTVALTGDGGDEAFGGYGFRYVPHALESMGRSMLPGARARGLVGDIGAHWPTGHLPKALRLGTTLENIGRDAASAYYADLCFLKPHKARALMGRDPDRDPRSSPLWEAVTAPYRRCPSKSAVQRAQYADLKVYLANDVLVKVDRMSMQHGLEVRCPLLDRRIIELAFRVPTAIKMPGLRPKHLLRRVARTRLPGELLNRSKRGFTAPVGRWIAGPYADRFRGDVFAAGSLTTSLLDRRLVSALFDDHAAGRADHSYVLWAIWMLERWARTQGATTRSVNPHHIVKAAS